MAIKIFCWGYSPEYLLQELQEMSSAQTGHLARTYVAYLSEDRNIQVMELLDGSLVDYLNSSPEPLSIDEVMSLATDIGKEYSRTHTLFLSNTLTLTHKLRDWDLASPFERNHPSRHQAGERSDLAGR